MMDADPMAVRSLKQLATGVADGTASVEVLETALAGKARDADLRIYNLERVSGIREPHGLAEIYPGLRIIRQVKVRANAASQVLKPLGLDLFDKNMLCIDAPGEERAIVKNLLNAGMLSLFSAIKVTVPEVEMYKGGADADEVVSLLADAEYDVSVEKDGRWHRLSAYSRFSPYDRKEIAHLTDALKTANRRVEALQAREADLEQAMSQKEAARASHEKNVVDLSTANARLEGEIAEKKAKIAELEAIKRDDVDLKQVFERELSRSELQIELLKDLILDRGER
ncbi:MAG: hypothetical protein AAGK02_01325 [Pseudomonadota bacterium]